MNRILDKDVNNIYECNLLHGILNSSKRTKNVNSHYYPILHGLIHNQQRVLFSLVFHS